MAVRTPRHRGDHTAPNRLPTEGERGWRVALRRSARGVRARVVLAYVLLLAAAVATMTVVVREVLLRRLDSEIEDDLAQEIEEVQALARGNNPVTGEPFGDDITAVFETFLSRSVPSQGEAFFTIVGGQPHLASAEPPAYLLADPDLVERWSSITAPERRDVVSAAGEARTLAVPVLIDGVPGGTFVVAIFPGERREAIDAAVRVVAIVGGVVLLVSSVVAWSLAGRVVRPVAQLTDTARRISDSDLTARIPVDGDDELARLGATFNAMIDRLEAAFGAQRAFMSDVAHELRTPITIVRGHVELLGDDPHERAETVEIVTEELDRMTRYVEDLLLLAKAEQPDFLRPEPVDYGELAENLINRVSAIGPRNWVLEEAPALGRCVGVSDPGRLTQAVVNLAANAAQHTAEGDTIGLAVRCDGERVQLSVRDQGPGIDPALVGSIFERHRRGDPSSRSRPEGAGLGLSIVAVIARAHRGTVEVDSTPGMGSTFTITVPLFVEPDEPEEAEEIA